MKKLNEERLKVFMTLWMEQAKQMYKKDGFLTPVLFAEIEEGEVELYATEYKGEKQKYEVCAKIVKMLKGRCDRYVQIAEAWMVKTEKGALERGELKPSQHPDRVEVIMVAGADRFGNSLGIILEIKDGEVLKETSMDEGIMVNNLLEGIFSKEVV